MINISRWIIGGRPGVTLLRALILACVCLIVFRYALRPARIVGDSMAPTFQDGEFLFINCLAYREDDPRRGDVIGIMTTGQSVIYLKRVIAVSGDHLEIRNGIIYLNGIELLETYVKQRANWQYDPIILGKDEYFVIGDNRKMNSEDHHFGKVKRDKILGKFLGRRR